MKMPTCFIVRLVWDKAGRYLLWQEGGTEPDQFVLDHNNKDIAIARSLPEIVRFAEHSAAAVDVADVREFDFDCLLSTLRSSAPLSVTDYRAILNGWNLIEDFARTLKIDVMPNEDQRSLIQSIYERLFLSANVLDVDPSNEIRQEILNATSYQTPSVDGPTPPLSREKRAFAADFLTSAWALILPHLNSANLNGKLNHED
jgi:hypothetical protein